MYNKYDLFGGPLYWNEAITKAFEGKKAVKCTLSDLPGVCSAEVVDFSPEIVAMYENLQYFLDVEIKKGRSHILSLCHAIRSAIDAISYELTKDKVSSGTLSFIINQRLDYFQRLPFCIDFDELCGEICTCHGILLYDSEFNVFNEMLKLEMLYACSYDLIYRDMYNMPPDEKLKAKMEYFITSGEHAYYPPELLIYKKSRGIDCDEDIAVACPFVKDYIEGGSPSNANCDFSTIASFVSCSEMRVDNKQLQKAADSIELTPPDEIDDGYDISLETFNLFRSDKALSLLGDKLRLYVKGLESYLKKHFKGIESDTEGLYELPRIPFQVVETTMIYVGALFVFAYSRLNENRRNRIIDQTISYLLDKQERQGYWNGCSVVDISSKDLTCMAIHALSATKPLGWKPSCKLAAKWLLEQRNSIFEDSLNQNILLLDSLSLAKEDNNPIFNLDFKPEFEKDSKQIKKPIDYSSWTVPPNICFIFNNKNRLLFSFNDTEKDLNIGHKLRAYKLLSLFVDTAKVPIDSIKIYVCSDKTKPNQAIRDINKSIILKLRSKFPELPIPDDFKLIVFSNEYQAYISLLPVKSLEQYNRDYIKEQEEIVRETENYKRYDN